MCPDSPICLHLKVVKNFPFRLVAGTFPSRSMDTDTVQGTQKFNNFLFSKGAAHSKAIFCRTISCTCPNCLSGALGICTHGFAPGYFQKTLRYSEVIPKISSAKNADSIKKKLDKLTYLSLSQRYVAFLLLPWVGWTQPSSRCFPDYSPEIQRKISEMPYSPAFQSQTQWFSRNNSV